MSAPKAYDLIVIGGGLAGIVASRFYLDVHPDAEIAVIERDGVVGGTWNKERLYPGFKAQASSRMCEFSDMPLEVPAGGIDENGFPEARHISEYLEIYLDQHIYGGRALRDRFHLKALVKSVKKGPDGTWHVLFTQDGTEQEFLSSKLLVATGVTSIPNIPTLEKQETFKAPIIHSIEFGRQWPAILENQIQKVAVLGGGKSAADAVYQLVKAGKSVTWIIRQSGKGPGALFVPKGPPGFVNASEAANTRSLASLFISGLKKKGWWDWWLWDTWFGQAFQEWFENFAAAFAMKSANFDGRENARESFKLLRNEAKPNFIVSPAGMIQQEDFWDTVATHVDVKRADIQELEYHKILFSDSTSLDSDAIILCTGYSERFPFFSDEDCIALGLPHKASLEAATETTRWKQLEAEAEEAIIKLYPKLKNPPGMPKNLGDIDVNVTPYRLYRCISPLNRDPTIAFVGFAVHPNMFQSSEAGATWAVAYLDGTVKLPDQETMMKDIAYTNAYMRLRIPTYGRMGNYFIFDGFAYYDTLLEQDLGLMSWRPNNWWAYWTHPNLPRNMRGLKNEYLKKYRVFQG